MNCCCIQHYRDTTFKICRVLLYPPPPPPPPPPLPPPPPPLQDSKGEKRADGRQKRIVWKCDCAGIKTPRKGKDLGSPPPARERPSKRQGCPFQVITLSYDGFGICWCIYISLFHRVTQSVSDILDNDPGKRHFGQ